MERLQLLGYYAAHHPALLLRLARATRFTAEYHQLQLARSAGEQAAGTASAQLAQVLAALKGSFPVWKRSEDDCCKCDFVMTYRVVCV